MLLCFLAILMIWHAIVPTISADQSPGSFYATNSERWVIAGLGGLFVTGHIAIGLYVLAKTWKRRTLMTLRSRDYELPKQIRNCGRESTIMS